MEQALLGAASSLLAPLESGGFQWVENAFDVGAVPAHSLNLERSGASDSIDFVLIIFDKRRHLRFQVLFGSKRATAPYPWIRSGALVWKQGSELVKYKWWGAKWWHLDKVESLSLAAIRTASLMPQVFRFLSSGEVGENVYSDLIATR